MSTNEPPEVDAYGADKTYERRMFRIFFVTIAVFFALGATLLIGAALLDLNARQRGESPRVVNKRPSPDDPQYVMINETKKPADRIPVPPVR